jgi:predicted nucleic acid-binding protein
LSQLVLDTGPLIALFYTKDINHAACISGFRQLNQSNTTVLIPIPILFEVYKWLLKRVGSEPAQKTLDVIRESMQTVALSQFDFQELHEMIRVLPDWNGSLEDATAILLAKRYQCPIWTLNHQDFERFTGLEFWGPR